MQKLVDLTKKNWVDSNEYKSIKKCRNEIVEILVESQSLLKFRFKNLSNSKKSIKV